jgi:hypothetical protein
MFRHALAPGNFDPPGFKLGDCATQRNLNDAGRHQARQIGPLAKGQRVAGIERAGEDHQDVAARERQLGQD